MEERIRRHVDELFAGTPISRRSVELKEEMIQNLTEKYNDLIAEGKTPEAAYNIAIAGIGDVSVLIRDLEKDAATPEAFAAARQKSAMFTTIAIMLYILSVVPVILFATMGRPIIGVVLMFVFIALATGMLIYNGMTKPKLRMNETMVEDFKQWQTGNQEQSALRKAINTALWTITVAIYMIVSFTTGYWHLTWLIFLLAVAVNAVINAAFAIKK
jgi:hypothetical protein